MDVLSVILLLMIIFSGILVIANIIILFRSCFKDKNACDFDMKLERLSKQISSLRTEIDALKLKIRKKKGEKDDYEIL